MISSEKKDEFLRLYKESVRDYFSQARGQDHLRRYDEARARARANFEEIKEETHHHGVPTEKVLQRLLPHTDSSAHRNSGAWIHVAPTIQGDIRDWFEAAGWTQAEDWPKVASAILNFVKTCSDNPSKIAYACREFVSLPYTTGLQTGMLTPILNALRPDDFMIINNKSRRVINYFTEGSFSQRLTDYPAVNVAGQGLTADLQSYMREVAGTDARPTDLFDMFCHWVVAEKKYAPVSTRGERIQVAAGEAATTVPDDERAVDATEESGAEIQSRKFPEMVGFGRTRSRGEVEDAEPRATFNAVDGSWNQRAGVEARIRETIERSIPNEAVRRAALHFLAFVIDNADQERGDAWYVRETSQGLRVTTGRLVACELRRSTMQVSVIGPVGDDIRGALGAEPETDEQFKLVPGGLLLTFPIEHAAEALNLLSDGVNSFVDMAMARVRRTVSLEDHVPEAVEYIASVVGRQLPQPEPVASSDDAADLDDGADEDDIRASKEPRVRGRAPIFEHGQRSIASLMSDLEREVIALPDLQRPFVWEDTKVRDLLDSLFVGFPVGTLVFWHTSNDRDARALGAERPGLRATTLVIDGQQRLTSLYAVMRGVEVVDKDGAPRSITIAFRPRDGRFEVADAAIRRDPEFLPNVTELWNGTRPKPQIRRDLMNALREKGRPVDDAYEDAVERNLDRAHAITDYRFPTVDIRKTATTQDEEATEEDVAEIFVRINNQGTRLGQADFVLTLLSVYHGELRDRLEERSRTMSNGTVIAIDTQQLLRAACGVAFGRARMSAVYRYLRGVDPTTGEADTAARLERLSQLDDAAKECVEPTPWRDFLLREQHAGFVSQPLIASKNAIVNAYAFYIRGRKAEVPKSKLDEVIARWLFGTLLTARYSGSSETIFEQDLARVARLEPNDADGFVRALDDAMGEVLTGDYWTQSLVSALETQKARSPAALAFRAAQIILGARALFADQLLRNLLDPPRLARARPGKSIISFLRLGSMHTSPATVAASIRSQTWRTLAGTKIP
jgi:Protein of unknown function DUF262